KAAMRRIEHQRAHGLAHRRAARFARVNHVQAAAREMFLQTGQQRTLARALAAFKRNQAPANLRSNMCGGHAQYSENIPPMLRIRASRAALRAALRSEGGSRFALR